MNINSMRNKSELLFSLILNIINVLLISETKMDNAFLVGQFSVPGYSVTFTLDGAGNEGGIMSYVKEQIHCRMLNKFNFKKEIRAFKEI